MLPQFAEEEGHHEAQVLLRHPEAGMWTRSFPTSEACAPKLTFFPRTRRNSDRRNKTRRPSSNISPRARASIPSRPPRRVYGRRYPPSLKPSSRLRALGSLPTTDLRTYRISSPEALELVHSQLLMSTMRRSMRHCGARKRVRCRGICNGLADREIV